jgi:4-hydroxy-4-methyl-2-oxoglutarate aldolase
MFEHNPSWMKVARVPCAGSAHRTPSPEAHVAGHAYTLEYMPAGIGGGNDGDYIDEVSPSDVLVFDNRGRTDCTVWGNILTDVAKARGVAGTVIDGVNRNVAESFAIGYPIWSRRGHMRTGKDRVVLEAAGVPVCLGTVRIEPRDVICADGNGVVAVPASHALDILRVAEEIEVKEDAILQEIRAGKTLGEARRRHGYHGLQTRAASLRLSQWTPRPPVHRSRHSGPPRPR